MNIPAHGTELYRIRSINMNYKELCELIEAVELLKLLGFSDEEINEVLERNKTKKESE